ncbi:uncharacterized protein ACNS7B_018815 isoform 1-T1 [Menidia menidia]
MNSVAGSKQSDGMNSYFERAKVKDTLLLNPRVNGYVPYERANYSSDPPVVRPKQRQKQFQNDQTRVKVDSSTRAKQQTQFQFPSLTEDCQNDIVNIMQRQNDITALLVKQNLSSILPSRNIPVFDGDPLQYRSFMNAFENGVEAKTDNSSDCLHFLEQFTRGQPKDLVHSCQHLSPDQGYSKAKYLLEEHFGNENKIASAYMEKIMSWTPIREQRLQSLRRRFEKDAQYKEEYTACVNNMLQQGYAEAVPADELQKDVTEESLLNKRWQICQKKEFCQPPLLSQTLEWITLVLLYSSKRIMDDGQSFECKPGRTGLGAFRAVANQDQCVGKTCDQTSVATGSITLRN